MRPIDRLTRVLSNTIAGLALTTFVIKVIGAGLAFASQVILARWLGSDNYGQYVYVIAWAFLLAIPFGMGFPQATIRFVANYVQTESWSEFKGLTVWLASLMLKLTGVLAILVAAYVFIFKSTNAVTVVLAAGLIPLSAILTIQSGFSRGLKRMVLAYSPEFLVRPLLIIAFAFGGHLLLGYNFTVQLVLIATVAAYAVAVFVQYLGLWFRLPEGVREATPTFIPAEWRRVATPLLLIAGFLIILNRTDVLMLGILDGKVAVAHYDAAFRTAALASFVLLSVNSIAAPAIASAHTNDDRIELQKIATHAAKLSFWPSLALSVVLALVGVHVLGMFGPDFKAAVEVLYILLVGQLINASVGSVGNLMAMTGYERASARIFGISALTNIVLNALAIPRFGAAGAATVTAFTMALWNIWMFVFVAKHLKIRSSFI